MGDYSVQEKIPEIRSVTKESFYLYVSLYSF